MEELEQMVSSEDDRCWCVYIHRNKINNKAYIGIAKDIQKRWGVGGKNYLAQRADGSYEHPAFAKALKKYNDWDNDWEHIIFQKNLTQLDAKHIEVLLIALFKTNCSRYKKPECGYNLTDGGEGISGYSFSDESKLKISEAAKERYQNPENHPMYGKHLSDETKAKLSDALTGIFAGESHHMYGKHHSEETKQKISSANKLAFSKEEIRSKLRKSRPSMQGEGHPNFGKPRTEEVKSKIRKSNIKRMKPVVQLDLNLHFIRQYESTNSASKITGTDYKGISLCCKNMKGHKTAGGYKWMYLTDYEKYLKDLNYKKET